MSSDVRSILVVDDVPDNVAVLFDFLRDRGFDVLVSESGTHALEELPLMAPDLILLDVMMPGLDGFETCRRIKADARFGDVPVFFMTALGDPVDKIRGLQVGAADYITKPIFPEEVLARIRVHLELRDRNRELSEQNERLDAAIQQRIAAERALRDSLDRAVLVVDAAGRAGFVAESAASLLRRYFPDYRDSRLPPAVTTWLGEQRSPKLTIERERAGLKFHCMPAAPGSALRLVYLEEKAPPPCAEMLLLFGLTPREAEILFWVAHGKTSAEIAEIVGNAPATVKKHVGSITAKLGVDTRLAAALRAMEVLGLPSRNDA
jgi:DNA-binding response OmpR family regulator/DNA-binding CsgD family transcriptional regulator